VVVTGAGIGLLYGVASLATKGLSAVVAGDHSAVRLAVDVASAPWFYVLGGCAAGAMLLQQAALQASRAGILIPVTTVVSNTYFLVGGTWLFREPLPASPARLALRLAGIIAAVVVLIVLSARAAARPEPARQPVAEPGRPVLRPGRWP
jgi:hypothetical protein